MGPGRTGPGLWPWPLLLLLLPGQNGPVSAISEAGKWILDVDSVSSANVVAHASLREFRGSAGQRAGENGAGDTLRRA